jgi:CHAT domain-containing protein
MKVNRFIFVAVLFLADSADAQQKFAPTALSRREALGSGQGRAYLAAMEALASESEEKERWSEAAHAYIHASSAAGSLGQLQKGIVHAAKAVELAQKSGSATRETHALLVLAASHGRVGQRQKEREFLQEARETVKRMKGNDRQLFEGLVYLFLGRNHLRQKELQESIEHFSSGLKVFEDLLSHLRSPTGSKTKNLQAAIRGAETQRMWVIRLLGDAHMRSGNAPEAIKAFERAMTILGESGLKNDIEAHIISSLGHAYRYQKDYPRALATLAKALQIAEGQRQTLTIQTASSAMADIYLETNRPAEAIPYFKKAIDTIESTRAMLESEELRTSFFENKGFVYGGIILAQLGAKNVEEAFNYNERARSRAFLDILGSKVQLGRHGALVEEERALQAKIAALKANQDEDEEGESDPRRLRQELDAAQRAYNDFLAKVRKESKEQASLMSVEPLTLKQVQELLDPGVTVLQYFVPRGRAVLWVIERDRVNLVTLSLSRSELIAKIGALRESISDIGEKNKFKPVSSELYRALLEPALPYIRGKELLIIPHDAMHYLPFQALISPQGKYLIQDYAVRYLSSASLMQFTREKKRASRDRVLALGNPDLGDPAFALRFAEREVNEVTTVFPKSAVYVRAEATKRRAVSLGPNYDILHFAVHGELKEDDPLGSGLLLVGEGKGDGKLTVDEIFSLHLNADTVILSACETGLGKIGGGDEVIGLTRAFIYAGTPSIVTTLWKVNDRASYELMREFYQHLKTGKKSEALRQAQLQTMKEFPEPFYWAAYQLTGEP